MVSWQAFPSLLPRAPLAFLSRLKLPFPKLPFPSLSNACHAATNKWCIANSKSNWCVTLRGGMRLVLCGKLDMHPFLTIRKAVSHDYLT